MAVLECIEQGPADAKYSVIWLHGLGADGHDFEPIVAELGLSEFPVRFVFPHAPVLPVTVNASMPMRAWFDICSPRIEQNEDEAGIRHSQRQLEDLIQIEVERGIPSQHIILAGFSQGGAIALQTGLRHSQPLGGIVALSSYLPLVSSLEQEGTEANARTPVFMAHGTADPIIPLALAEDSLYFLQQAGYPVEWKVYPMQHQVCLEEISDIASWLRQHF